MAAWLKPAREEKVAIFLKWHTTRSLQLENLLTQSTSKGGGRETHYHNIPPETAEEDTVKSFWNCSPFIYPREKMCILIQKGTCKNRMPNSCPHSEQGNVMLWRILKKRKTRKEYMKKALKKSKPQHSSCMHISVDGHGNWTPRPVHARRREGKKCKAATTAIRTISHERGDKLWHQLAEACELCNNNN